ncbi:hypothetical protein [Streptomyces ortus]|uniref:Uncharacterized protein n=1 Tax=Streptomyces ortus TaxID=2867268 RepID=A0ABT3V3G2_9ACTN|nr:hypothetical protein [Streptomyces ortus]MCX4232813.1 hypothetical protein [Streptomyces ortus]
MAAQKKTKKTDDSTTEINARTTDGPQDGRFHREYVVPAKSWNGDVGSHEANKVSVLQQALHRGLHPRGDVSFDGQHDHPDGQSLVLPYSVDVLLASEDDQQAQTNTPSKAIERLGGSTHGK